ncbi:MAG: hypothetical protein ACD_58C00224G0002 [uncultured bacterium]|nr:MAG: hypothetical protein ACD_58C00224G0002 [uncultured bacterium]
MSKSLTYKFSMALLIGLIYIIIPHLVLANDEIVIKVRVAPIVNIHQDNDIIKITTNIENAQFKVKIIDLFSNKTVDNFDTTDNNFKLNNDLEGTFKLEVKANNNLFQLSAINQICIIISNKLIKSGAEVNPGYQKDFYYFKSDKFTGLISDNNGAISTKFNNVNLLKLDVTDKLYINDT